ncbi:MAG TPA: murein L,D-transpeptidase catalytic domain family protein [Luteimonas sp.]|nr:murein L,D-transpeptidase catalytic domain family protein [Luteimonas sp.]
MLVAVSGCTSDSPPRPDEPAAARTAPPPSTAPAPLLAALFAAAPAADPAVLALALQARGCAISRGAAAGARLAVIDYSRPSTEQRLWVFDLQQPRLLYSEHVAHGRNSGENFATHFSNRDGSLQSSLGLFRTAETYDGDNGYSLRMDGLEPGVNDRARDRALVMHGAWYVDPLQALKQGRLGRSLGCPALRTQVAHAVIDSLKQGQLLFAYYPDRDWLAHSRLLDCAASATAAKPGATRVHITAR